MPKDRSRNVTAKQPRRKRSGPPAPGARELQRHSEPSINVKNLGNGFVLLTINEAVPWPVALSIIERLQAV